MDHDFLDRLRRLGVVRGTRQLKIAKDDGGQKSPPTDPQMPDSFKGDSHGKLSISQLIPHGRLEETPVGLCFIVDHVYPLTYRHGDMALGDLLNQSPDAVEIYCQDHRFNGLAFQDFLFLDTETTGLMGAGTLAFMVGVAFFEQSQAGIVLIVRQYFLRDHADEAAMLYLLDALLDQKNGIVTFNGRTFDIPLLTNRYLMNRLPDRFHEYPHLDLLPLSRRLWRMRFGSVALNALEKELLVVHRTEEDVPGWLIPTLYNDYLRSGDAREMRRIFYHNQIDMLSMVTLAAEIFRRFNDAQQNKHPIDLFSLGKWQMNIGLTELAELNLRQATNEDLPLPIYHQSLQTLGLLLKREGRRKEAVLIWQQWATTSLEDVQAHLELAKHYEWHEIDLDKAKFWTEQAIALSNSWPTIDHNQIRPELEHRLDRLRRKLNPD